MKLFQHFLNNLRLFIEITFGKIRMPRRARSTANKNTSERENFEKKQRERYLFHSMLKAGDTYKLGEATVTLAKFGPEGKIEVAAKIAAADARREARQKELTEFGEKIMLMSKEELYQFGISEWLKKREDHKNKIEEFEKLPDGTPEEARKIKC